MVSSSRWVNLVLLVLVCTDKLHQGQQPMPCIDLKLFVRLDHDLTKELLLLLSTWGMTNCMPAVLLQIWIVSRYCSLIINTNLNVIIKFSNSVNCGIKCVKYNARRWLRQCKYKQGTTSLIQDFKPLCSRAIKVQPSIPANLVRFKSTSFFSKKSMIV